MLFVTGRHAEGPSCAGLLQGLPDGTEEEQLYQFEEEMERNSVMLRQYKSSNEQVISSALPTCLQPSSAQEALAEQDGAWCLCPVKAACCLTA